MANLAGNQPARIVSRPDVPGHSSCELGGGIPLMAKLLTDSLPHRSSGLGGVQSRRNASGGYACGKKPQGFGKSSHDFLPSLLFNLRQLSFRRCQKGIVTRRRRGRELPQ